MGSEAVEQWSSGAVTQNTGAAEGSDKLAVLIN